MLSVNVYKFQILPGLNLTIFIIIYTYNLYLTIYTITNKTNKEIERIYCKLALTKSFKLVVYFHPTELFISKAQCYWFFKFIWLFTVIEKTMCCPD